MFLGQVGCHGRMPECELSLYSLKSEFRESSLLYLQDGFKALLDLEENFLQQAPSRVHNVLRNVGKFPLIITTNMDELLERFLWKTGNGGEKIRLDQVRRSDRDNAAILLSKNMAEGGEVTLLGRAGVVCRSEAVIVYI